MNLIYLVVRAEIKFQYSDGEIEHVNWNQDKRIPYLTEDYLEDIFEYDVLEFIEEYMINKIKLEEDMYTKIDIISIKLEEAFYFDDEDNPRYF